MTRLSSAVRVALLEAKEEPIGAWRHAGDPPLPGGIKRGPKRRRPPADPTYGSEPDLLDKAGVIVEPDVRRKIASYYDDMLLREVIKRILSRK
jgi:hypothetical protein